ncbi:MAG: SAM-dependent methyltransferase [Sulfobacillus thermosulfidooxidans]|nr:MAG: SAM-dependent methyltransferase [Sulfobacillus thermosulfidooxidans]
MEHAWNATHYDDKLGYVAEFGKGVVALLQPQQGEHILDLGCGTGELTQEIATAGAFVIGMDLSESMIQRARQKYPALTFRVGNAEAFQVNQPMNAVFSNAALHWMRQPTKVIKCVWDALDTGGRFVAEFGGKGNVMTVIDALDRALGDLGINAQDRNPWYFPSIGEYTTLLEHQGFKTTYALHFARPTPMPDGDKGIEHWLNGFAESFLSGLDHLTRDKVVQQVIEQCRPVLYRGGQWYIDYQRLRIVAEKK